MTTETATEPYNICTVPERESAEPPLLLVLIRDLALASVYIAIALSVDAWARGSALGFAAGMSAIVAFPLGFLANGLLHEWGHYVGAKLTGSTAPRNSITRIFPMFHFDINQNSHRQFLALSLGGNIFQWLFAMTLLLVLHGSTIGQVSLQMGAIAFALLGSLVEVPIIIDALKRGNGIDAWNAYLPHREQRKRLSVIIGGPIVVALFFVL
ncbi:MAG: hypothetical protein ACR2P1_29610 [Pseudomonadales bacterium]